MEEIKKLVESYEVFLRNADKVLLYLRNGELKPQFETAAKAIASVEQQIRDVEALLPKLRAFIPAKPNDGMQPGWTTDPNEADRKPF